MISVVRPEWGRKA